MRFVASRGKSLCEVRKTLIKTGAERTYIVSNQRDSGNSWRLAVRCANKRRAWAVSAPIIKQLPLSFGTAGKTDVRTQFAALCYRLKKDKVQVLLVTSRGSGRWIVPKGWPMDGKTPADSAATEAWEEAGVTGKTDTRPLGMFSYSKTFEDDEDLACVAMVYAIKVKKTAREYPEAKQRRRKWVSRKKAAAMVDEPELARIIRDFDPRVLY